MDKYTKLVNSILKSTQLNEYGPVMATSEDDEPTVKSSGVESALTQMSGGKNRRAYILAGKCILTGEDAGPFRDEISEREYKISGIGQKMQDKLFDSDEEKVDAIAHEDDEGLKALGLDDDQLNAVAVAGKLATKAGGLGTAKLTQNKMNAAYGKLMSKVADKVKAVADKIQ